jgi:pimeloyl-ACP methyl ester carboxylesterase
MRLAARRSWSAALGAVLALAGALPGPPAGAATLILRDGRVLRGKVAPIQGVAEQSGNAPPGGSILLIDDGLRRYFICKRDVLEVQEADDRQRQERYVIPQTVPQSGNRIAAAGPIERIEPFDDYGRRILTMQMGSGKRVDLIQGITEITPVWTKVESLRSYILEQYIATSSIPRDTLSKIFKRYTDATQLDQRLKVVRLYLQSERYQDARDELAEVLRDFPDQQDQLAAPLVEIQQLSARRLLDEAKVRADAGQHMLAYSMLDNFPTENVAGEILQEVRERLEQYEAVQRDGEEVLARLEQHRDAVADERVRARLEAPLAEIAAELNVNTLPRMATYRRLWDDEDSTPEVKLSLAISGWLQGSDNAEPNLSVSLSVYELRDLVRRYLNEPGKLNREQLLDDIRSQEGADLGRLSRVLAHMRPALDTEPQETPGFFELRVPGLEEGEEFTYFVQLPPEYDPLRRYPTIVTLHAGRTTPQHQIAWWAGDADESGTPRGHAARNGYIVVAPAWAAEHQRDFRFEAREHAAVLHSLRDACRRFAIDTDRVFLTGHSMGGVAAWDIALAHPDLWAGVIPIVAHSNKFFPRYWKNARRLPWYFVCGELDGTSEGTQMLTNAVDFDRYLKTPGFRGTTIAEFKGRGHEHFSDEILNLFDWMGRQRREFFPADFEAVTLRAWDDFFWWVELSGLPDTPDIDPDNGALPRGVKDLTVTAKSTANNGLNITAGKADVTVWLSPELLNFDEESEIKLNGKKLGSGRFIEPDVAVLLEDVRTRGDRQHPFWAKVESPAAGRVARDN